MMASRERCAALTRAGRTCRAWPVRGERLCAAHGGVKGRAILQPAPMPAPPGLEMYERALGDGELAAVAALYDQESVKGEVAAARVVARRLLTQMGEADAGYGEMLARFAPLVLEALRTVAALMETEKGLAPRREGEIAAAIGQALDELGAEWGVEL